MSHFRLPPNSLPFPSLRKIVRAYNANAQDGKQRHDIGCITEKWGDRLVLHFTEHDLNVLNSPHLQDLECERCHLPVPDWAFGEYYLKKDENGPFLDCIHRICLGCWPYDIVNPRYDYLYSSDTPPPCTCPPGSKACDGARTGCVLHNVIVKPLVPGGVKAHERPLLSQEVREQRLAEISAACLARDNATTDEEYRAWADRLEELFERGERANKHAAKIRVTHNRKREGNLRGVDGDGKRRGNDGKN
ncbi:hypothetical protein R3P38DRAFT_2812304 [Favolaschia claudopus]|uniref:Uncharacterized protein n=1 Tax=Favolaschia claudopus TaxID=2862362 RepID=A0AAV9Z7N0_9AGAR